MASFLSSSSSEEDCPSPIFPSLQKMGGEQPLSDEDMIPDTPPRRARPPIGFCGRNCRHCIAKEVEQWFPPLHTLIRRSRSAQSRPCPVRSRSPAAAAGRAGARTPPPTFRSCSPSPSLSMGRSHHSIEESKHPFGEQFLLNTMMGSETQREYDQEERRKARRYLESASPPSHTPSHSGPPHARLDEHILEPWDPDLLSCSSPTNSPQSHLPTSAPTNSSPCHPPPTPATNSPQFHPPLSTPTNSPQSHPSPSPPTKSAQSPPPTFPSFLFHTPSPQHTPEWVLFGDGQDPFWEPPTAESPPPPSPLAPNF